MIGTLVVIEETDRGLLFHYQSPPGTATTREVAAYAILKTKLQEAADAIAKTTGGKLVDAETGLPTNNHS